MNAVSRKTEVGIDITDYISDRASGSVRISKDASSPGNFIHSRDRYSIKMIGRVPTIVNETPELRNINMGSVVELSANLAAQEALIKNLRLQIAAIISDMAALP